MNNEREGGVRTGWMLVLLLLTGCTAASAEPPRLQQIRESGQLRVATAVTRPFEYYDEDGVLVGFDVDLMTLIGERLGVTVEWREMAFADLLVELDAGNADVVIAALYIRSDREERVDMSQPYLDTGLVLVSRADRPEIRGVEDLSGQRVGVKEGATGEAYARRLHDEQGIALELHTYADTVDSLDDLRDGLLDAVFNDRLNSLVYSRENPQVRVIDTVLEPAGLGIAVRTGDHELLDFINQTLQALRSDGTIDGLFANWISDQVHP